MDTKMETQVEIEKTPKTARRAGIAFGVLLILLGGALIGVNFGLLPDLKHIIISWQMLLIVIGISSICRRHLFGGLCLILLGGFFMLPKLADVFPDTFPCINDQFVTNYWSILLIAAGILIVIYGIVMSPKKWQRWNREMGKFRHHCSRNKREYEINGEFSKSHVFSSGEYIVLEPEFRGGELKVVFGAAEIDLRKTSLPEGDTYLEIKAIFSGVDLIIPNDWKIDSQIECAFSGIADKRYIRNGKSFPKAYFSRRLCL